MQSTDGMHTDACRSAPTPTTSSGWSPASLAAPASGDHRLDPAHRCPAAVDDAVTAYRALLDAGATVTGEPAGAGLATATLPAARRAGLMLFAASVNGAVEPPSLPCATVPKTARVPRM